MGTRGALGYVGTIEGERLTKVSYNHYDSYPSELGCRVVEYIQSKNFGGIYNDFTSIELVDENAFPTKEQVKRCSLAETTNLEVSLQSEEDWYCLLRGAHGRLDMYADVGYMIDSKEFLYDSLFCEWAYILNMDTKELEIYRGFQKDKDKIEGRYGDESHAEADTMRHKDDPSSITGAQQYYGQTEYYAISLIKTVPFNEATEELMCEIERKESDKYIKECEEEDAKCLEGCEKEG